MDEIEAVLEFWFGPARPAGTPVSDEFRSRWWHKDPAFDTAVRERFGALYDAIARGEREAWLASARGRLAYLVVLDQFSRNMFRGSRRAFAEDPRAQHAALGGIAAGMDRELADDERAFFYLPLMHAEDRALQDRCVAAFERLRDECRGDARAQVEQFLKFAEAHRTIVQRFGRFPHRNEAVGRTTTHEELAFLRQQGSGF
jgi:uncharacterized protein (DUF924 family)